MKHRDRSIGYDPESGYPFTIDRASETKAVGFIGPLTVGEAAAESTADSSDDILARALAKRAEQELAQAVTLDAEAGLADITRRVGQEHQQ